MPDRPSVDAVLRTVRPLEGGSYSGTRVLRVACCVFHPVFQVFEVFNGRADLDVGLEGRAADIRMQGVLNLTLILHNGLLQLFQLTQPKCITAGRPGFKVVTLTGDGTGRPSLCFIQIAVIQNRTHHEKSARNQT
ncbi:MAG: hypothetical protein ACJAUE_000093 [Alcanivorax sp.]|jgi:hypothetical protein